MYILSFDIGIKNLSYVLLEIININTKIEHCYNIIEWDIINIIENNEKIKDKSFNEISKSLFNKLISKFPNYYIQKLDYIVLENQPVLKNPIMKSIQVMIYSYFMTKKIENDYKICVKFQNANLKIKLKDNLENIDNEIKTNTKKLKYNDVKKIGIYMVNYLFESNLNINENIINKYNNTKKKDDLADSLLQGLYFCINNKIIN
jgi:hypothetical protein